MEQLKFEAFISKLSGSVLSHSEDVQVFTELKKECMALLDEFRKTNHTSYDALRELIHFNLEVKQILKIISFKKKSVCNILCFL